MKKNSGLLLACLVCILMTLGIAVAETPVQNVPQDRIGPDALSSWSSINKGEMRHQDGEYHLHLNTLSIDWYDVVASQGGGQDISTSDMHVLPYAGANSYVIAAWETEGTQGTPPSDDEILQRLEKSEQANGRKRVSFGSDGVPEPITDIGIGIATYVEQENIVSMYPRKRRYFYAYRWYDAAGNHLADEKLLITVTYEETSPKKIASPGVPANRLPSGTGITAEQGKLTCRVPAGTASYTVVISALDGMTTCFIGNLVRDDRNYQVQNGKIAVELKSDELNAMQRLNLEWSDGSKEIKETLAVTVIVEGDEPWPAAYWKAADLKVSAQQDGGVLGGTTYENGMVTWRYTEKKNASNPLENARLVYSIEAPKEAAYAKVSRWDVQNFVNFEDFYFQIVEEDWETYAPLVPLSGHKLVETHTPFLADYTDPNVTLYHSSIYQGTDYGHGSVYIAAWFDKDGKRLTGDAYKPVYWCHTSEEFMVTRKGQNLSKAAKVRAQSTSNDACFADENHLDWTLECRYRPQYGENAYHVELTLKDGEKVVQPDGTTVFYLPYPDGYSFQSGCTYRLKHYDPSYRAYTYIPVIATEQGLRFEADSLSPFVLSWEAPATPVPAPTPNVPKTGDNTPIALWLVLMTLSAAGVVLMRRKAKA